MIERVETAADLIITAVRVYLQDQSASFHATSFIKLAGDKIASMDEYWADDGTPPQSRLDKPIGRPIQNGSV